MAERAPQDPELYEAVADFVRDARSKYRETVDERTYLPTHSRYPTISYFDQSGFPYISTNATSEVPQYDRLFGLKAVAWVKICFSEWDSWKRLVDVVERHERLTDYYRIPPQPIPPDAHRSFWLVSIQIMALQIFDRLMHLYGIDFDNEQLLRTYLPIESGLLDEQPPVSFVVPIALTSFPTLGAHALLGDNVHLMELSEDLQLARMPLFHSGAAVNGHVLSAATHALVLTNWFIANERQFADAGTDLDWYPLNVIDRFFHSVRIVTGADTGYAQIFLLPVGWARSWTADLPAVLTGALGRRYPPRFEKSASPRKVAAITEGELEDIGRVYRALAAAPDRLGLAARRLSTSMLREDEADTILDLCIGLEAALGDPSSTSEITHKLGLRAAAVLALDLPTRSTPSAIHRDVKDIYSYRSAVAHGVGDRQKKQFLRDETGRPTPDRPAIDVATTYMRRVLHVLLTRPDLASAKAIDEKLILKALQAQVESEFPIDARSADAAIDGPD